MKNGWVTKKLGEVCEVQLGKMLDKAKNKGKPYKYLANLSVRWRSFDLSNLRTMPFMDSEVEKFSLRPGDILMCEGGEPGRCAIWQIPDSDIKFQKAVHRIRSKGTIEPAYLVAYFESIVNTVEFNSRLTGATIKHLPRERLLEIPIPIPPLAEQKRIVAKIAAAFEKIDELKANTEKNLANAKELFQSALDEAMRPKKGWVEKRLGEVCEGKLSYGTSSSSKGYDARVRYIRITDIDDNGRLLNDFVSPKEYEAKHVLEDGDLVFARTGATVGKSYMYSPSDGACVYAGYLIRARVDQSIIRPKYLFYFTKTSRYKLFIQLSQAAAAQPNVNAEKYGNMLVPIPPVHEQDEIVSCIGKTQGLILQLQQNYSQQIADCAEMRQAILREAFEGKI